MSVQRIAHKLRELGLIEVGWSYLANSLKRLTQGRCRIVRYHFVAQPAPRKPSINLRPTKKCIVDFVKPDNPLVAEFPRPLKVVKKRFEDGNICIAAQNGGIFSGYIWLANDHYDEDEVRCRYQLSAPNKSVLDFDVYVHPDYRLSRSLARLWEFTNTYLARSGKEWSFSRITASNIESIRSHRRLGTRTLFTVSFICVGEFQLMLSSHKPFVHTSFSSSQVPTLRFNIPSSNIDPD